MKQKFKAEFKVFFPGFWERYRRDVFYQTGIFCIPAVLHLAGLPKVGFFLYWVLIGLVSLDIILRLPRFIQAVRTDSSRPFRGWCLVDWSVFVTSVIVGTIIAIVVGLF